MGRKHHRRLEVPRWCLVVDDITDLDSLPRCVPIGYANEAMAAGTLVAIEDPELTGLTTYFQPYMDGASRAEDDQEDHS